MDGKTLLVLSVAHGTDRQRHHAAWQEDQPVEFYVRRDATTFPGRPEVIRASVPAAAPG
jgi:hypothetical protein